MNQQARTAALSLSVLAAGLFMSLTSVTATDDPGTNDRAQTIHANSLVLDAHADIVLPSTPLAYLDEDGTSQVAPEKLKTGGVGAVIMSVAVGPGPRTKEADQQARALADQKIAAVQALAASHEHLTIAASSADILSAKENGQTALILGFQNARALEGDLSKIDEFYRQGVRVFAFNHLGHNDFSDSSRPIYDGETKAYEPEEEHQGLSALGIAAAHRIIALGGIIDVSQMSKNATLQVIQHTNKPVIASHSNVKTLSNVTRNLSDEEIDRIGAVGGVIHVAAFGAYLVDLSNENLLEEIEKVRLDAGLPAAYSYPYELYWELEDPAAQREFVANMRAVIGTGNIDTMLDHLDYIVERIGVDHVGIGSDFNHGGGIEGFNNAAEAPNVTKALLERGYSAQDIEKIWGANFIRVMKQAEAHAAAR